MTTVLFVELYVLYAEHKFEIQRDRASVPILNTYYNYFISENTVELTKRKTALKLTVTK